MSQYQNLCPRCFKEKGDVSACQFCGYESAVEQDIRLPQFTKRIPGGIWGLAAIGAIAVLAPLLWLIIHYGNPRPQPQQVVLDEKLSQVVPEADSSSGRIQPDRKVINLRSSYKRLSVSQIHSISNISIRSKADWGFYGHSTINHSYKKKSINGDNVVIDHSTNLMWHQSGSSDYMDWYEANDWVKELNSRGYAGYRDWRLPTVEEAASLLKLSENNGLYIDPLFSNTQKRIWTGDKKDSADAAWRVDFYIGRVLWYHVYIYYDFVRPVRSGKCYPPN